MIAELARLGGNIVPDAAKKIDGKKFMWDGVEYETEAEADKKAEEYKAEEFEVEKIAEEGKSFLYTRRVVTEIVLEGEAPI